jgi:hypothetical protein
LTIDGWWQIFQTKGLGSAGLEKMLGPVDFRGKEMRGLLGEAGFI